MEILLHQFLAVHVPLAERAFVRERVDGVVTGPTQNRWVVRLRPSRLGGGRSFQRCQYFIEEAVVTRELRLALVQLDNSHGDDVALAIWRGSSPQMASRRDAYTSPCRARVLVIFLEEVRVEEDIFPCSRAASRSDGTPASATSP